MLAYYAAGNPENPMIVLVHGVCDSATAWADLTAHLAQRYFVVALDSLGHGLSRRYRDGELAAPGDAAIAEMESTLEYLEQLYERKPIVISHSMGAAITSKLSTLRPDLLRGMILEDPAWLSEEQKAGYRERAQEQVATSQELWRADPAGTVRGNHEQRPNWSAASHFGWAFGKALVDERLLATGIVSFPDDWREIARRICVPALVVTSDTNEVLIGIEGVSAIAELGNAAIATAIIPGTGHGVRLSKPEEFHALVDEQLAQWAE